MSEIHIYVSAEADVRVGISHEDHGRGDLTHRNRRPINLTTYVFDVHPVKLDTLGNFGVHQGWST